ncbi:MAG: nitroreductase/quinone reductase family protein [Candidatus Dormibacter sp.]
MSQTNPSVAPAATGPNPVMRWMIARGASLHAFLYKRGMARKMGTVVPILVTVKGRTSGKPITIPLGTLRDGLDYVVIASMGGADYDPQWWKNMLANPNVTIQDGDKISQGQVEWVSDPNERSALWKQVTAAMPNYAGYEKKTTRLIPLGRIRPLP